jgi:hypothetical protein
VVNVQYLLTHEGLQKREKELLIRCKFINFNFSQCDMVEDRSADDKQRKRLLHSCTGNLAFLSFVFDRHCLNEGF